MVRYSEAANGEAGGESSHPPTNSDLSPTADDDDNGAMPVPSWLRLKPMNSMDAYGGSEGDYVATNAESSCRVGDTFSDEDGSGGAGSLEMTETRSSRVSNNAGAENGSSVASDSPPEQAATRLRQNSGQHLPRHLSLFDLVSIGVGGTVGSGIFVLCGLIAREHAGPATCLSWAISGFAAFLSGFCYAELSGRIPSPGSSYSYAYACMGELVAFLTAACLTLEFLVSGSAVARSWGDKVVEWLSVELGAGDWVQRYLVPGYGINPMAFVVSAASTAIVVFGVRESKVVTDFFTWTKVGLVIFMAVGGLILFDASNMKPFIPPQFGVTGVMRGATTSFFGYLGFDGICAVAGEAKNPTVNLPRSIMITLVVVTVLYLTAAVALTGMQHYSEINGESGFPEAFKARGIEWAAQLTAAGEVFTLPVVVLISCILQPRLQYALARDGLAPQMFCEVDEKGNLRKGTLFAGSVMTLIATFVPFTFLDDFVSAGILVCFSVTNCSVIVMRRESPVERPLLLEKLLLAFNGLACFSCLALVHGLASLVGRVFAASLSLATVCVGLAIARLCPVSAVFGGRRAVGAHWDDSVQYFRTPMVPLIPCLGCIFNWYLIAQLEIFGMILLLLYFALSTMVYFKFGAKNSRIRGRPPAGQQYEEVNNNEHPDQDATIPCVEHEHVIT